MGTARHHSPVLRPANRSCPRTNLFSGRGPVERGPKMRFLLVTVLLVAGVVMARDPKINTITLDSCIGTSAPVNASTRPLELREQDEAAAAAATAEVAGSGDSGRSLSPGDRSAYVEEM